METHDFIDNQNRNITLQFDDSYDDIQAYCGDVHIGGILFNLVEDECSSYLKVINMYLDKVPKFKRSGIGSYIIKFVEGNLGYRVTFGSNDGSSTEDGSHLTGDGPAFARSILKRKK